MPRYLTRRLSGPAIVNPDPPEPVHKFKYPYLSPTHDKPKKKQLGEKVVVTEGFGPPEKRK